MKKAVLLAALAALSISGGALAQHVVQAHRTVTTVKTTRTVAHAAPMHRAHHRIVRHRIVRRHIVHHGNMHHPVRVVRHRTVVTTKRTTG